MKLHGKLVTFNNYSPTSPPPEGGDVVSAETRGFEPLDDRSSLVFKTSAFGRSATSPWLHGRSASGAS